MQTTTLREATTEAATTKSARYAIDPSHSSATFSVRHMMISNVRGEFQKLSGELTWDPARPELSSVQAVIDVASINTREPKRDEHLRSADFFDVENFPTIAFASRSVKSAGGELELIGDLTIHGVTREVTLAVEAPSAPHKDPWGNLRIGASARTKIKRSDFGMTYNSILDTGGVLVGDEITIALEVQLVRKD